MANPITITQKIIALLKQAGIDYSKMAGKVDPNKISQLITKTQKTATKPKLIDALNKEKATYQQALDIFENDAKYLSQMNEMEQVNFANNLEDYFTVGGKVKYTPSNVVTQEGTPVVGKQLETLSARKGAKGKADDTSLQGAMQGLMSLVDDLKGISPKMRNKMDRDELVEFIRKMRGRDFTNEEIKFVREYVDKYSIGLAKDKRAPAIQYAKKLGAKNKDEFEFVEEYLDNIQTTSPEKFREMYGNVKNVNMDINTAIDNKLEKHFRKKYKWDKTKNDGGLDDATFEKYDDELYQAQNEFSDFHRVYDTFSSPGAFGTRKSTSFANHPNNYLDDASEKLKSITGEGLNVDFYKNYTDDVLTKYPKPEKFQYGGLAPLLGEPTYADGGRTGFAGGKLAFDAARRLFLKLTGGAVAGTMAAKSGLFGLLKGGAKKAVIKDLTSVPIKDISGMPVWFKPLVNKVIKEGDDVTKKLATKEREIVHTKKLDEFDEVTVTQDLDTGNVRVEYHGSTNMGEAPIQLDYKAGEIIEPTKTSKGIKTKPEFSAVESEPRVTNWDGDIEWDGENVVNKVDDLLTDTTKLETYATGKKPNIKKLLKSEQKKKYVNKLNDDQMEQINFIENKHGPGPDPTDFFDEKDLGKDFASGGRVPFFKGKLAKGILSLGKKKKKKLTADDVSQDHPLRRKEFEEELFGTKEQQESKKFKEKLIKKLEQYHKLKYMDTKGKKGHAFGGRVPLAGGKIVGKILSLLKDPKKLRAAVDDIFSSGDYKMDAQMASEALVENNPKAFGGKLLDDLDDATRSEIYGAVLRVVQSDLAKTLQMKRLSKPTKTLEGIEKTGTINISDPNVADEFTRFMKETDPKGHRKIEEIVEITNFDPKGRKKNAFGGLAGMLGE